MVGRWEVGFVVRNLQRVRVLFNESHIIESVGPCDGAFNKANRNDRNPTVPKCCVGNIEEPLWNKDLLDGSRWYSFWHLNFFVSSWAETHPPSPRRRLLFDRSEERRVGKEGRSRWS